MKIARGYIECSDPNLLKRSEQIFAAGEYEMSASHIQDFINSVRSGKGPIAPVEVGVSTNILCYNVNIAHELGLPVKWDPVTKRYFDDKEVEGHRLYYYEY